MEVRIDQGAEGFGALKPRIKIKTELARQRQVGALSGGGYDPIDRADPAQSLAVSPLATIAPRSSFSVRMANPVVSSTRPRSTSSLTFAPSSPRPGNWSAPPPL